MTTVYCWIYLCLLFLIIQTITAEIHVYNTSEQLLETIQDQEPNYEPTFPSNGLKGYLLAANPPDGCRAMSSPPSMPTSGYQWIALIRRSTDPQNSCSFTSKIVNAYHANFSAVIIYNYEDELVSMQLTGDDINIPSTFITHEDGLLLLRNYIFNASSMSRIYLKILPSSSLSVLVYLIPFVVIIGISFLCLLGLVMVRCCLERRRSRLHRLPRSALKQLPTKKFVKTDPWEVCAICLDDYQEGAKLRILPCQHAYHMKCIDPWLINSRRQCPCCKRYVFPNHENPDGENDDQQQTATEQTPLITSNDESAVSVLPRSRQLPEQQTRRSLANAALLMESSDEEKDEFLSSGPTRTATTTTAELVFERSALNSRRYGSFSSSPNTAHGDNFFVASINDPIDSASASARSTGAESADATAKDHRFEQNQAFVHDEYSINSNHTHL